MGPRDKWQEKVKDSDKGHGLFLESTGNMGPTLVASPQRAKLVFAWADLSSCVLPGLVAGFQAGPEQVARIGLGKPIWTRLEPIGFGGVWTWQTDME